jgi:hypothetical protein
MIRNAVNGGGPRRWRAAWITIFVIPAILCGAAVKLAHAGFYKAQPMLSDGVDDDTTPPIRCVLVEATTKEFSLAKAKSHAIGKVLCPLTSHSQITPARIPRSIAFADQPRRLTRVLSDDAGSSNDPDGSH